MELGSRQNFRLFLERTPHIATNWNLNNVGDVAREISDNQAMFLKQRIREKHYFGKGGVNDLMKQFGFKTKLKQNEI